MYGWYRDSCHRVTHPLLRIVFRTWCDCLQAFTETLKADLEVTSAELQHLQRVYLRVFGTEFVIHQTDAQDGSAGGDSGGDDSNGDEDDSGSDNEGDVNDARGDDETASSAPTSGTGPAPASWDRLARARERNKIHAKRSRFVSRYGARFQFC